MANYEARAAGLSLALIFTLILVIVFLASQPTAQEGWYDALCKGEVVESVAGTVCLVDGKVELMPQYENRTN